VTATTAAYTGSARAAVTVTIVSALPICSASSATPLIVWPVPAPPHTADSGEAFAPAPASTSSSVDIAITGTAATMSAALVSADEDGVVIGQAAASLGPALPM